MLQNTLTYFKNSMCRYVHMYHKSMEKVLKGCIFVNMVFLEA